MVLRTTERLTALANIPQESMKNASGIKSSMSPTALCTGTPPYMSGISMAGRQEMMMTVTLMKAEIIFSVTMSKEVSLVVMSRSKVPVSRSPEIAESV